jgi:hypothetical protein
MAWMASRYLVESIMRDSHRRSLEKDLLRLYKSFKNSIEPIDAVKLVSIRG